MSNEYLDYYLNQSGSGISGFSGLRYQKGNSWKGFFKFIRPVLSYFTKQGIKTAADIGKDILEGESIKDSAKKRLTETGKNVGRKAIDKLQLISDQIGSGKAKRKYIKKNIIYWKKKKHLKSSKTSERKKHKIYKKAYAKNKSKKEKFIVNKKRKTVLSKSIPFPY